MNTLHGKLSKMCWDVPPVDSTNSSLRNHSSKISGYFRDWLNTGSDSAQRFCLYPCSELCEIIANHSWILSGLCEKRAMAGMSESETSRDVGGQGGQHSGYQDDEIALDQLSIHSSAQ